MERSIFALNNTPKVPDPLFSGQEVDPRTLAKRERMSSMIRSQIVLCGGCELTNEQLGRTSVAELLNTFAHNGIEFEPKFSKERLAKMTPT